MRGEYNLSISELNLSQELPPRARRIHSDANNQRGIHGTTSACAENTRANCRNVRSHRNYLRVRGEYGLGLLQIIPPTELPPRARRIQFTVVKSEDWHGTTSACAENTPSTTSMACCARNYLRVRGEYRNGHGGHEAARELPPRARRIPGSAVAHLSNPGTTSACAENTPHGFGHFWGDRNYLRVRGEYLRCGWINWESLELPPRARRIRQTPSNQPKAAGTTSACAENTVGTAPHPCLCRNYLRVRGEYTQTYITYSLILELPPRARRIPNRT